MISYHIISKSGDIIYQPTMASPSAKASLAADRSRIRFLPLLLIKDMIRANLQDPLQYVRVGKRTVVFLERHGLLYVACSRRPVPVRLLLEHLRILDRFLRFSHGPMTTIPTSHHTACLAELPFLHERQFSSSIAMCHVEQLELHNDLRTRLTFALHDCCHTSFSSMAPSLATKRTSFFASHPRRTTELADITRRQPWSHAFLFAGDRMVARCINSGHDHLDTSDLYFVRMMVNQHLHEHPKSLSSSESSDCARSSRSRSNSGRLRLGEHSTSSASSPTLFSLSPNSETPSPRASAFVYRGSSSATPFKVREKSAPSAASVASPPLITPVTQWSSPPSQVYNHLLTQYVDADNVSLSTKPSSPTPGTPAQTPSCQLPRNAKILYNIPATSSSPVLNYLSSSLPSETKTPPLFRNASARSSPLSQSRRQSVADQLSPKDSIKHLFANLLSDDDESQGRASSDPTSHQGKTLNRWLLLRDEHASTCAILLTRIDHGLYAAVICPQRSNTSSQSYPPATQLHAFRTSLYERLRDYSTFLLTKQSTHFTILSFALVYPGLIHFVHLESGIMTAPRLVDLNEQDTSHDMLHEVYRIYDTQIIDEWPTQSTLKTLCDDMICKGLPCLDSSQHKVIQKATPGKGRYTYLFQQDEEDTVLLAVYFDFVPSTTLWAMHERLLHDISQRQPANCR